MEETPKQPARSFKDLRVWREAYNLALEVYKACEAFPQHERYALTSQMCRAAVSVCSNIAEGFGRRTAREKDQFYSIANGSLTELENQILIAQGIGYIDEALISGLVDHCTLVHKMLVALQRVNKAK